MKINEPSSVMFEPAEAPPPQLQHDNESTKNGSYSTESSNLFKSSEQTSTYHVPNLSSTEFECTESSEGTLDPLQETGLLGSAHGAPNGTDTSIEDSEQPPLFCIQEEQFKPSPLTLSSSVHRQERNEEMVSSHQV